MKRVLLFGSLLVAATVAVVVLAQPGVMPVVDKNYNPDWKKLRADVTNQAGSVAIEPRFKGINGDRFAYEIDYRGVSRGTLTEDGKPAEAYYLNAHWATQANFKCDEDVLEGRNDLRLAVRYDSMNFLVDNGKARYSGYIGPEIGGRKSMFHEVARDGTRSEVANIPGWAGINARTVDTNRSMQSGEVAAVAWFSISDHGRLYNEVYYADFGSPDQRNYPGRFQDPVFVALGLFAEFPADASLKVGETVSVRRRLPVGAGHGATTLYDVTYKLEKLYGTVTEPVGARFSFTAVPAVREHTARVDGLDVKYTAPDFRNGSLLLDLVKGVPLHMQWAYTLKGSAGSTTFENDIEFTASLRKENEADAN